MRSILLVAIALVLPQLASAQVCTTTGGAFGSANAPVTANLCSFTHQLAQDCAGTPFAGATPQAIYAVTLNASSNAVIRLAAGTGFTPYIALWPQGGGCSGSTACGAYENIGASAGTAISLPSTSGLAAGTYDLLVGDVVSASTTCPSANAQFTLSITSGSTPVKLQAFSVQ